MLMVLPIHFVQSRRREEKSCLGPEKFFQVQAFQTEL